MVSKDTYNSHVMHRVMNLEREYTRALNLQYPWQRKRALVSGGGPAEVDGGKRNRCLEIDAYVPPDSTSNVTCGWIEMKMERGTGRALVCVMCERG